ncbi:MAG: pitrilysin family protein [Chthoniobacteraceae bacterium]
MPTDAPLNIPGLPEPAQPKPFSFPQPVEKTLDNGLRVVFVPRSGLPLLTARILIRSGAEADPQSLPGLADFTANLITKGAANLTAPQIAETIEALGGSIDSEAGWDGTSVTLSVLSKNAEKALPILADVIRQPAFATEEIERLRAQALDALMIALQQPSTVAGRAGNAALFAGQPYGHASNGTPDSLKAMQRADIVKLHDAFYRPDNTVLILVGDLKSDDAFAFAQKFFGDWKKPEGTLPTIAASKPASDLPPVTLIDLPQAGQSAVEAFSPGIPRKSDDYFAGIVTSTITGGGYSSRLNQEIRIKRGLSYGATAQLDTRRTTGAIIAACQTKNESASEVVQLMKQVFAAMAEKPVSKHELDTREALLTGAFSRNLETNNGFVAAISRLAMLDVPLDMLNQFIPKVTSITADDVQHFAKAHFTDFHYVVAGQGKTIQPMLEKDFGKVELAK